MIQRCIGWRWGSAALLLASVLSAGSCGGSGSGSDDPPPLVEVLFPPGGSFTEADSVTVRGRSAGTALSAVTVGGIAAASVDGFLTWSALVPLAVGVNTIDVVATRASGGTDPSAPEIDVTRGVRMGPVTALDFDPVGNRLVLLDPTLVRLTLLDLDTGEHTLLSGTGRGTGPAFDWLQDVLFDIPNNRALATDSDLKAVFAVDLATGNRTFVTGQGTGSGTALSDPRGIVLHAAGFRLLLVDYDLDAVVEVSLATGARTVLSGSGVGMGAAFESPIDLVHDVGNDRVYVRDVSAAGLFRVSLATGDRVLFVEDNSGHFATSGGMALDLPGNRILASDAGFDLVFETDLTSGTHTTISNGQGSGPDLVGPGSLVHDPANGRVIVGQGSHVRLLEVALSDGDRSTIFDQQLGSGTRFDHPESMALELRRQRVLVADEVVRIGADLGAIFDVDYRDADRRVFLDGGDISRPAEIRADLEGDRAYVYASTSARLDRVDLDDGDQTTIAGSGIGVGESLQAASDFCYDAAASRFLFTIGGGVNGILAVDEATGDRTIFANAAVGTGESTSGAIAIDCDPTGAFVYYGTNSTGTIAKVDVGTGVRTLVTQDPGVGPSVGAPQAIRLDAANGRLIVFAAVTDSVIAVSLANGVRTELSGPNVGAGVPVGSVSGGDVDLDREIAVFSDESMEWLVVVDLTSGDRVGFSR